MERLIVEFAFRAALIAAAAAVVLRILRITTAAAQHAVWAGVLVVMLALPAWISWGPKAALPLLPARGGPAVLMNAASVATADSASNAPVRTGVSGRVPGPARNGGGMKSWDIIWMGVYLLGTGVLMLRLAVGTIRANRLTSASCAVPVTVGLLRPRIVLPECWKEWPEAQLDAVLTHERAHARRRDPLVQWVALLNRALFWFHPLAWWLEQRLSALAEEACDSTVIEQGHDPRAYSEYLLELARVVQRAGMRVNMTGMAMPGSYLPNRIRKMIAGAAPRVSPARMVGAAIAWATCSAIFAAGTLQHVAKVQIPSAPPLEVTVPTAEPIPAPAGPVRKPPPVLLAQANPASVTQTRTPQSERPRFEVASIKPTDGVGASSGGAGVGSASERNTTVRFLLWFSYRVQPFQIVGGPGWIDTDHFDIEARAEDRNAGPDQVRLMLQSLLEDRFHLKLHREMRVSPIYALMVAKGGPKMKLSADQTSPDVNGPSPPGSSLPNHGAIRFGQGSFLANAVPLSFFARMLSGRMDRLVVDRTNLPGRYDFLLQWKPGPGENSADPQGQTLSAASDLDSRGSIFTAIQEQMGLKLESGREPVEVLVVDHIERPSEN
jgi:bla regulator protein BlaR1